MFVLWLWLGAMAVMLLILVLVGAFHWLNERGLAHLMWIAPLCGFVLWMLIDIGRQEGAGAALGVTLGIAAFLSVIAGIVWFDHRLQARFARQRAEKTERAE